MDSLSLHDDHLYRCHSLESKLEAQRFDSPHLPTPGSSCSGSETHRTMHSSENARCGPSGQDLVQGTSPRETFTRTNVERHGRAWQSVTAPDSPPYHESDTQKPLLPPLQTVCHILELSVTVLNKVQILGDNLSSPPRTPNPYSVPGQLSPREPAFTAPTYKPPALYPNKKQRIELILEPAPPHASSNSLSSPALPSASRDYRVSDAPARSAHLPHPGQSLFPGLHSTRRASVQTTFADGNLPHRQPASYSGTVTAQSHYRTPEQTPTSTTFDRNFPPSHSLNSARRESALPELNGPPVHHMDRPYGRSASMDAYSSYQGRPYDSVRLRNVSHPACGPLNAPLRDESRAQHDEAPFERHAHRASQAGPAVSFHPYQHAQPSFFMPSYSEYQHGKARKRSNLPKQSTEIMRTWFDQVSMTANPTRLSVT